MRTFMIAARPSPIGELELALPSRIITHCGVGSADEVGFRHGTPERYDPRLIRPRLQSGEMTTSPIRLPNRSSSPVDGAALPGDGMSVIMSAFSLIASCTWVTQIAWAQNPQKKAPRSDSWRE